MIDLDTLPVVLSLGAGVQSSAIFLMSCLGVLPRIHHAIFADTQYEPQSVYKHLAWLEDQGREHGIPITRRTRGNLRQDAIEFRQHRKSSDGKRFASIPFFVKNPDGSQGTIRRQCTKEYKIEVADRFLRRDILGLAPRARAPKQIAIDQWFGISADEPSRCSFPGTYRKVKSGGYTDLHGEWHHLDKKQWVPQLWQAHTYPLCRLTLWPDRRATDRFLLSRPMDRQDCKDWLLDAFPDRVVPRSACICCPYRSNAEWKMMRDEEPEAWADAVEFDKAIRLADAISAKGRSPLAGLPFIHRSLIPLDMVNLDEHDGIKTAAGCGTVSDGECAGLCGM